MAQANRIDGNTLSWVKSEIDQTMESARRALETYVENTQDESQLRFCVNYLHQVYGTLQMVELYGAGMLANELERLSNALISNHVKNRNDAYEVMMRGMMQLPDYLERLQQGAADYPIILLPLLNDLRAARGAPLLSESALFSPNLEVDAPIPLETAEDSIDTLIRKLRHAYHLGLLDWFRDEDVKTGLKRIAAVIERLRPAANDPDTGRVLWAASGLIEALREDGVNSSISVKLLMGQVDREFKKIIDKGEFALSTEPPVELLKNLLYYVASSKSQGATVSELKSAFHLKELMPDTETLERARADLSAPNAALMRTVTSVLLEDLTQVKDSLDVFVRSEQRDLNALNGMSEKLTQMGDTLDMLGFGPQRMQLQDQVTVLREMSSGQRNVEETALMDVASALLNIESALGEPAAKFVEPQPVEEEANDDTINHQFADPEQRKLVRRVVDEVKVDLNSIKEAFNDYSRAHKHTEALRDVPAMMDRIRGSLSMLTLNRVADILGKASEFIKTQIIDTSIRPDSHTLDLLADSISSVEYYLESLTESWGHPTAILDVAEQSLAELKVTDTVSPADAVVHSDEHPDEAQTLVDVQAPDLDLQGDSVEPEGELTMELSMDPTQPGIESTDVSLSDDEPDLDLSFEMDLEESEPEPHEIEQPAELASTESRQPGNKPAAAPSPATQTAIADELDDEIVEIFLEEADEEHSNISRLLPHWHNSPDDGEALKDLRRSFHTLKGSGRLVGAADLGEFAWAFENLLNRVIDKSIQPDGAMFQLLEQARNTLPGMFELFRSGQKPGQEVFKLMQQAEQLSKGEKIQIGGAAAVNDAPAASNVAPLVEETETGNTEPEIVLSESFPDEEIQLELDDTADIADASEAEGMEIQLESLDEQPAPESIDFAEPSMELNIEDVDFGEPSAFSIDMDDVGKIEQEMQPNTAAAATAGSSGPTIDPVLLGIYRKEIATHLQSLREYILEWREGVERSANHRLIRALHTLKGSSRTASVPQIAELCNFLEDHVKYLQDGDLHVDAELVEILADSADFIEQSVEALDHEGAIQPDNVDLIRRTRNLLERTRNDSPTMQLQMPDTESDLNVADIPEILVEETDIGAGLEAEPEFGMAASPEYDQELLEIFLEEGVEILDESDHALHDWIQTPENTELVKSLQRQLHTLKGGARMAGVSEIGDLSHSIENMLTAVMDDDLGVSEDMFRAMQKAQDRLVGMLDDLRNNRQPHPAKELIQMINALAEGDMVDLSALEDNSAEISAPAQTLDNMLQELEIEDGPDSQPDISADLDPELSITLDQEAAPSSPEDLTIDMVEFGEGNTGSDSGPGLEFQSPEEPPSLDFGQEIEIESPAEAPSLEVPANNVVPLEKKMVQAEERAPVKKPAEEPEQTQPQVQTQAQQRPRGELIRVRSDLLDNLVNFAGEVSIYRSRMEQQTNAFRYNLTELDDTVSRLRGQLRQFEIETEAQIQYRIEETGTTSVDFDPLEFDRFTQMQTLSRGMLESLNDLNSLRGILVNLTRESETLLLQQSRVNTDLQEGLMRTRMVPISGQIPRMRRIVRQTSEELGKRVEVFIDGAENELDRTILERIMSPLEHMLRNAIAHGIEKPELRRSNGKDETGKIKVNFTREGSDLVITVTDDGGGINHEAIHKKAIERGLLKPDAVVHKDDLLDFILESGFSTAEEVTQIAGRGVGMDVVNSEIKQLGGLLDIKTEQGKGTQFIISMPMSLSVTRALMIRVGEETYAIPLLGVQSVERVSRDEILRMQSEQNGSYHWLENEYRYINLGAAMGVNDNAEVAEDFKKAPILLVRSGEHRAAIHVDSLIGSREIVVKPVGPQLSTLRGISGATVLGDGSVVLILDLGVLIRLASVEREDTAPSLGVAEPVVKEKRIPLVMVVDDSITVRKVTTRLLERNNFKTISAKDGVDALAQLQENKPDVMLLDVEMPRMDGFELATNIRNDDLLNALPIIMITSRTGQKHRDRAMNIGVNIYMGKPYSEGELLDNINMLLNNKE